MHVAPTTKVVVGAGTQEIFELKPVDNYYNKAFTMLGLAELHGYRHIVSIDDDVLTPPTGK